MMSNDRTHVMHELQYLALTKECIGKHTRTVVVKKIFFDKIFLLKKKNEQNQVH